MTKVVSTAQRIANAANAQLSTGPKTPEGKTATSHNALKHGLLSRALVLEGPRSPESRADFDALLADLLQELKPNTVLEEALVQRIASCCWRMARAQRFETGTLREALETPLDTERELRRQRRSLAEAEKKCARHRRIADLIDKPEHTPEESAELERLCQQVAFSPFIHAMLPKGKPTTDQIISCIAADAERCQLRRDRCAATLKDTQRLHDQDLQRRPLTLALPQTDALSRVVRYENMLDRQLHRALTELRHLQTARAHKKDEQTNPSSSSA